MLNKPGFKETSIVEHDGKKWLRRVTYSGAIIESEIVPEGDPQDTNVETILKRVAIKLDVDIEDVQ